MKTSFFLTVMMATGFSLSSCSGESNTNKSENAKDAAKATKESNSYVVTTEKSSLKWEANKVGGGHHGTIKIRSGNLEVEDGKIIAGKFEVDMNSIVILDLTNEKQNNKLKQHLFSADFFEVNKYPVSTFEITSVENGQGEKYNVKGNLVIKGISKNITIPSVIDMTDQEIKVTAGFSIDRNDWDIQYGGIGDVVIKDAIHYELTLVADKK